MSGRKTMWILALAVMLVAAGCNSTTNNQAPADQPAEGDVSGAEASVTDIVWQWTETITPVEKISVDDPAKYTLQLLSDGQVRILADCNSATTSYSLEGQSLKISEPMAMTMAFCGEDSLSDEFVRELTASAIHFMDGEDLMIDMMADGGTMRFTNGGPSPTE